MERRLAAILIADVYGYTRLMGEDEAGTLQRLTTLREGVLGPLIAEHAGRIVKLMGDGLLVVFASIVDAVGCAIAWQTAVGGQETKRPEGSRLIFRIGVNLGDVLVEGDDIYGDGVNIAARLEALAEPGGICLSGDAYRQVRGKIEANFEDLGEREVKNVAEPLRVYRIAAQRSPSDTPPSTTKPLPLPDKPSIAVLPFDNMSGDPEQEYLADGISEDLITALSKIRWFFVIARNSTFTYKDQAVEVTQVAKELGVRYVIEGSVRKAGNRVRVTAQLIDAMTGRHVWAERYDRDLTDIFELQDEMTQTIVAAVEPELGAAERERAVHKPPENLDAWETYQRGLWHLFNITKDHNAEALRLLRRVRELDPDFAAAYAYEAFLHYMNVVLGWTDDPAESLAAGMTTVNRALALDDKDAVAYFAAGRIYVMRGEHDASIAALETSLSLDPNFAQAHYGLGFTLAMVGQLEEALERISKAERLSPRDPMFWGFTIVHAFACLLSNDYEAAVHWAQKTLQIPRAIGHWPHAMLAAPLAHLGRMDEARAEIKLALEQKPDLSISHLKKTFPTKHPDGLAPYIDGLRKAGLPE
jgi:adenylate cyclase